MKRQPLKPAWYRSPLDLPERKSGKLEVHHRIVIGETPIVSARQAYTRGIMPVMARLSTPLRVHELHDKAHGVWMTDLPEELNQIAEALWLLNPQGRVCVGGLGLGIVAKTLTERKGVKQVVVVERDSDVIALCAVPGYEVVPSDIRAFLADHPEPFDFYLLDTWQGTSEETWWTEVLPLRRVLRQRWGRKPVIHCWAEDIMWGQVARSLLGPNRVWLYKGLPAMSQGQVRNFLHDAGLPHWEKKYGAVVDSNLKPRKEKAA